MSWKCILFGCLVSLGVPLAASAAEFESPARTALAVDHATGLVLYSKNATAPEAPASMSKLMTLYLLFEAIRDGKVTLQTEFPVSSRAQSMGGSRMFVEAGTSVPVEDLIHGIIVQSGNDACVVVAEGLAGTEAAFATRMNERAAKLGMKHSTLKNASGWPEDGHLMSAEDLVSLSRHIISEFPEYYAFFKETEFTWNDITQPNRNPLLKLGIGADGLKTGHTAEAGYGLVGSAVQNDQRIVFMLSGLDSEAERAAESEALVKWAFSNFETAKFFSEGDVVAQAEVWLGVSDTVPLVAPVNLQMLVPLGARDGMAARVIYSGPVEAPVAAGQNIGQLVVDAPGLETVRFDLVAGAAVARGGIGTRIAAAVQLARDQMIAVVPGRD